MSGDLKEVITIKNFDIEKNKALIERYPFLKPRNEWTGKDLEDYDYSFTELDSLPRGWVKAFGEQMCEELREVLIREDCLDEWRIDQLKEKFGEMRLYPNFYSKDIDAVINKYTDISATTCVGCGKPATHYTTGWILPFCWDCLDERERKTAKPIEKNPFL